MSRIFLSFIGIIFVFILGCKPTDSGEDRGAAQLDSKEKGYPPLPETGFVDMGDYNVFYECGGSGSPTVVIVSGMGGSGAWLHRAAQALSKRTRICVYDRGGLGRSGAGRQPRDVETLADEFERLLNAGIVDPPYVVVAWSWGGLIARQYIQNNLTKVAGLVLVDSQTEDCFELLPSAWVKWIEETLPPVWKRLGSMSYDELQQELAKEPESYFATILPPRAREELSTPKQYRGWYDEVIQTRASCKAFTTKSLGDLPVRILGCRKHASGQFAESLAGLDFDIDEFNQGWFAQQKELTKLSTRTELTVLEAEDHMFPVSHPEIVVNAVISLLSELQSQ